MVGVTGRTELTPTDRAVLGSHLDDVQTGMVSIRPRYVGDALRPAGPRWEPVARPRLVICARPKFRTEK